MPTAAALINEAPIPLVDMKSLISLAGLNCRSRNPEKALPAPSATIPVIMKEKMMNMNRNSSVLFWLTISISFSVLRERYYYILCENTQ